MSEPGGHGATGDRRLGPHRPPPPPAAVPEVRFHVLDGAADLAEVFAAAATAVGAVVHDEPLEDVLRTVVARHGVGLAVHSAEPDAVEAAATLASLASGVAVEPYSVDVGAAADLGITGCIAAAATTGTVFISSAVAGSRGASLLPRVHLCVVARSRLLPTPGDLWRRQRPDPMPSQLVAITGPSRTGDIEQIITTGVHGPVALHIALR